MITDIQRRASFPIAVQALCIASVAEVAALDATSLTTSSNDPEGALEAKIHCLDVFKD